MLRGSHARVAVDFFIKGSSKADSGVRRALRAFKKLKYGFKRVDSSPCHRPPDALPAPPGRPCPGLGYVWNHKRLVCGSTI